MIDANQGVHLVEVDDMQAIFTKVRQGFETNKKRITFIKS
jgi:hypothetical protein